MLAVRADEAMHREVNHHFSEMSKNEDIEMEPTVFPEDKPSKVIDDEPSIK